MVEAGKRTAVEAGRGIGRARQTPSVYDVCVLLLAWGCSMLAPLLSSYYDSYQHSTP